MTRLIRTVVAAFLLTAVGLIAAPKIASTHASHVASCTACKHITISLSRERLRAWEGHTVVLVTPITAGNATLPTPTGHFVIFAKRSPYTFVSPWPKGSPKWYPTSQVSFALEFLNGGYFIHDAPWRGVFGHGTNSGATPGTNYGGTHGCVNVPYNAARFLYYWAPLGTRVHIVP